MTSTHNSGIIIIEIQKTHRNKRKGTVVIMMTFTTKYESTMKQWEDRLRKAEEKLHNSKQCYEKFGDEDSKQWIEEDMAEVEKIKKQIETVKARFAEY